MSGAKFTPGPWAFEDPMGPDDIWIVKDGVNPEQWEPLANVNHVSRTDSGAAMLISWAEQKANARLIASAPELLEALIETRTSLMIVAEQVLDASKADPRWEGVYEKLTPYLEQSGSAIAKATGDGQ